MKSVANERHGARFSVGIIRPGEYHFGTGSAERMHVTCGEIEVKQDEDGADAEWSTYETGTSWEVAPKSGMTVRTTHAAAYYCEYL